MSSIIFLLLLIAIGLLIGLIVTTSSNPDVIRPDNIFSFGDSTDDPGNLYHLDPSAVTDAKDQVFPVPDPNNPGQFIPVISKQRFSNHNTNCDGKMSNRYLAETLGLKYQIGFKTNLTKSNNIFIDYSISGAEQGSDGYLVGPDDGKFPSVEFQISEFKTKLANSGRTIKSRDLFLLRLVGANEFPAIAGLAISGGVDPAPLIAKLVGKAIQNIQSLYDLGARNFVCEIYDDSSPYLIVKKVAAVNPAAGAAAVGLSHAIGGALLAGIENFIQTLPGINFVVKGVSVFNEWMTQYASDFGIIDNDVSISDQLDNNVTPNYNHRFWDDIHSSSRTHREWSNKIHQYVLENLANIPT